MCSDVGAPACLSEGFLRCLVSKGKFDLVERCVAGYFAAYSAYAGKLWSGDVDVCTRRIVADSSGFGSGAYSISDQCGSGSVGAVGVCQGESVDRGGAAVGSGRCIADGFARDNASDTGGVTGVVSDVGADGTPRVSLSKPVLGPNGGISIGRGPNYERNQLRRNGLKKRVSRVVQQRNYPYGGDLAGVVGCGDGFKRADGHGEVEDQSNSVNDVGQQGFWKSCSPQVRQELIDSKARMHIAENERREREARDKLSYMDSPYGVMQRCVKMAEFAQKQAAKEKDGKIYGWAQSVACSSAESLAKTLPSSVPSYEELSAKLEASSQSSFELELQAKQNEIDSIKSRLEEENRKVQSLVDEERKKAQEFEKKYIAVQRRIKQMELDSNPQVRVMSFSKRDFEEEMRPPRFRGVMG